MMQFLEFVEVGVRAALPDAAYAGKHGKGKVQR